MTQPLIAITGAGSGVGMALTKLFATKGYPLLLMDLNTDALDNLDYPNLVIRQVDITDKDAVVSAIKDGESLYGKVDLMVNNAGLLYLGNVPEQNEQQWEKMFAVNVYGMLNCTKAVMQDMINRQHGTIINMGSLGGKKSLINHSVYCGSKAAVHAINETLREEMALNNVRVSTIAPGAIETNLIKNTTNQAMKDGHNNYIKELGGVLKPEDLAKTVAFIYEQPQSVCIREIVVATTKQVV